MIEHETVSGQLFQKRLIFQIIFDDCTISLFHEISRFFKIYPDCFEVCIRHIILGHLKWSVLKEFFYVTCK